MRIALFLLISAVLISAPADAQRRDADFADCVLDDQGPAGAAVKACYADYMDDLHEFARLARPRPITTCRRGCGTLARQIQEACPAFRERGISCDVLSPRLEQACRHECDGETCEARCLVGEVRRLTECASEEGRRARRRCERRARQRSTRCIRTCRR